MASPEEDDRPSTGTLHVGPGEVLGSGTKDPGGTDDRVAHAGSCGEAANLRFPLRLGQGVDLPIGIGAQILGDDRALGEPVYRDAAEVNEPLDVCCCGGTDHGASAYDVGALLDLGRTIERGGGVDDDLAPADGVGNRFGIGDISGNAADGVRQLLEPLHVVIEARDLGTGCDQLMTEAASDAAGPGDQDLLTI